MRIQEAPRHIQELFEKYGCRWEYEDNLEGISDAQYDRMFPFSVVDGVRMFPYIVNCAGERIYIEKKADKTLFLLIGPSGAGKTTLGEHLKQWGIPELISHTTRPMRKGESYSSPYYFVDIDTFYATEMVEYTEYNGFLYGTSKDEVDRVLGGSNSRAFVIVDRVGVEAFKALYPEMTKVIYIYASGKDLIERMTARGDNSDIVAERIAHAYTTGEFNNIDVADYCIVNKEFDKAIAQLKVIVGD